jgi:hypothetical protein
MAEWVRLTLDCYCDSWMHLALPVLLAVIWLEKEIHVRRVP